MAQLHSSASKKLSKLINRHPQLLISLGIFIFLVGATHYYQLRILSFDKTPVAVKKSGGEIPTEVIIPSINIDEPVDVGEIDGGVWKISYSHPTFLDSSARPGDGGNIIIYGHNKKAIFGSLPYVSVGQIISLKTKDQKIYRYKITDKYFVSPNRVDLVSPTDHEELTIYTCWGLLDSKRAVIKASPI